MRQASFTARRVVVGPAETLETSEMKTLTPAFALCCAALAAASLAACNQSSQPAPPPPAAAAAPSPDTTAAPTSPSPDTTAAAVPPPPTPPPVPQYNRTAEQESRWQHYLGEQRAYEAALARARAQGQAQQAAADTGRQDRAFNAGREVQGHIDQGRINQARQQLAEVEQRARLEPDPHRRQQMIAQAQAQLSAAEQGR
jgi:hypothetical protein